MKEMLGNLADGQIEFYKAVCTIISPMGTCIDLQTLVPNERWICQSMEEWERIIPIIQRIRVDVQ